jgi:hypothetical protein
VWRCESAADGEFASLANRRIDTLGELASG